MDVLTLQKLFESDYAWAIICIAFVGFIIKKIYEKNEKQEEKITSLYEENEKKAEKREARLMDELTKFNESQERITVAVEGINDNLTALEGRVDRIEKNTHMRRHDDIERQG